MSLEERILALERKLLDPDVRASSQELDRLIADDFVEFGSSGRIWNKRDVLSALPRVRCTFHRQRFCHQGTGSWPGIGDVPGGPIDHRGGTQGFAA